MTVIGYPGEEFRYAGALECLGCGFWLPSFEDAIEWDDQGNISAWSGVVAADDDECQMTHIDYWDGAFSIRWEEAS